MDGGRRRFGRAWIGSISGAIGALTAALTVWWWLTTSATPRDDDPPREQSSSRPTEEVTAPTPNDAQPDDDGGGESCQCSENCEDGCEQKFKDILGQIFSGVWEAICGSSSGNVTVSGAAATALAGVMVTPLFLTQKLRLSLRDDGDAVTTRIALWAIRVYQRRVAPRTSVKCRFRPSCSRYGYRVIARYGLLHGSGLAVARIRRCSTRVAPDTSDPPP